MLADSCDTSRLRELRGLLKLLPALSSSSSKESSWYDTLSCTLELIDAGDGAMSSPTHASEVAKVVDAKQLCTATSHDDLDT